MVSKSSRLRFIQELLNFGRRKLGLDFGGSFEKYDPNAESANWLYVSRPFKIVSVLKHSSKPVPFKFSWDRPHLKRSAATYRGHGYDTYVFSAEGHGGGRCPVTPALLASSPARCGYVVIHEGWHSTLHKEKVKLPYRLEEATGRAIGCFGIIEFARESGNKELLEQSLAQEIDWANFASFINRWHGRLTRMYTGGSKDKAILKTKLMEKAQIEAAKLKKKMKTQWEQKELEAKLNNAFFLRYHDYTCYYSIAASVVKASGSLRKAAESIKGVAE
jgi:predicted aminopeptidase